MASFFDQYVNRYTQPARGLETKKVHQIIAKTLCERVNLTIVNSQQIHLQKREWEGRPPLPSDAPKANLIDGSIIESNIATAGFDTRSWVKLLSAPAHAHMDEYHRVNAPKAGNLRSKALKIILSRRNAG
jgi:hypothetical protein